LIPRSSLPGIGRHGGGILCADIMLMIPTNLRSYILDDSKRKDQMARHIPTVTGKEGARLARTVFGDSPCVRIPLDRADEFVPLIDGSLKLWMDPCVDGMHDIETRRSTDKKTNPWFEFMTKHCSSFESIANPESHKSPDASEITELVSSVMNKCAEYKPTWITIPQFPIVDGVERNKINRLLAKTTAKWRDKGKFGGKLILPMVFTHQAQLKGKTERNPKIQKHKTVL
jgi:hypothetical protein